MCCYKEIQEAHHRPEEATALEGFTLGVQQVVACVEVVAHEVDEANEWNEGLHQTEHENQQHRDGVVCELGAILHSTQQL